MEIKQVDIGEVDGLVVKSVTMKNDNGMSIECSNYGCAITKVCVPNKLGEIENVVLGYKTLQEYINDTQYVGVVVGRVGGRIHNSEFELNGTIYKLTENEKTNHLHGGFKGLSSVIWDIQLIENIDYLEVKFTHTSFDGEEGYPGNINLTVSYRLTQENELLITYDGTSDKDTIVSMTNHSYFNLSGNAKRNVLNHRLTLKSNEYVELNKDLIPTGAILDVINTPFDFREGKTLVEGVQSQHPQINIVGNGYDHPFILNTNHQSEIELSEAECGIKLIVETNNPCVVIYSANFLNAKGIVKDDVSGKYLGICLETQGIPDSINHSNFPSIVLKKGEKYHTETKYRFGLL